MKGPGGETRRVWRMTADSPLGEYLELVPKEAQGDVPAPPKRIFHPETPTTHKAVELTQTGTDKPSASSQITGISQTAVSRQVSAPRGHTPGVAVAVGSKVKVLRPAQVESWQSSSFDLLTGLVVRDVSDTIPGQVFDELFRHGPTGHPHPGPRRPR